MRYTVEEVLIGIERVHFTPLREQQQHDRITHTTHRQYGRVLQRIQVLQQTQAEHHAREDDGDHRAGMENFKILIWVPKVENVEEKVTH